MSRRVLFPHQLLIKSVDERKQCLSVPPHAFASPSPNGITPEDIASISPREQGIRKREAQCPSTYHPGPEVMRLIKWDLDQDSRPLWS